VEQTQPIFQGPNRLNAACMQHYCPTPFSSVCKIPFRAIPRKEECARTSAVVCVFVYTSCTCAQRPWSPFMPLTKVDKVRERLAQTAERERERERDSEPTLKILKLLQRPHKTAVTKALPPGTCTLQRCARQFACTTGCAASYTAEGCISSCFCPNRQRLHTQRREENRFIVSSNFLLTTTVLALSKF
jgi:hypothetical protein